MKIFDDAGKGPHVTAGADSESVEIVGSIVMGRGSFALARKTQIGQGGMKEERLPV
ncbi:MAG: hypothetical protein RBR34_12455 [Rhodospirillaceae bacterium]|nr:hypothetical protein [Rhodospirillaceae bacterium]